MVIKVLIDVDECETPYCRGDILNILIGIDEGILEGCVKFKVCDD